LATLKSWNKKERRGIGFDDQRQFNKRPFDKELDEALMKIFNEMRAKSLPVDGIMLKMKALELKNSDAFVASPGWLQCFLKRNNIVKRKRTHIIQKLRENYDELVKEYFKKINEIRHQYNDNVTFVNFDEIPMQYDLSHDSTLSLKGKKQIDIISHNGSKNRFYLCPAVTSDGEVLGTLILFVYKSQKNKKTNCFRQYPKKFEKFKNSVIPLMIRFNPSGFNNEKIFGEWVDKVLVTLWAKNKVGPKKKLVFVIDAESFHSAQTIKDKLALMEIDLIIIPGGTTSILQPLDVALNKPFKDQMRKIYTNWLTKQVMDDNIEEALTNTGYLRQPTTEDLLEWVRESKDKMKKDHILTSFDTTGITNSDKQLELMEKLKINFDHLLERLT